MVHLSRTMKNICETNYRKIQFPYFCKEAIPHTVLTDMFGQFTQHCETLTVYTLLFLIKSKVVVVDLFIYFFPLVCFLLQHLH